MNNFLTCKSLALRTTILFFAMGVISFSQFREIGPAPFPPAQAHQKIRVLLDQVDSANRQQTVKTIVGWLDWYRDVADDELIAAWKGDKRGNLNLVIDELGDARVAAEIAGSWRQPGINPAVAPILAKLMTRYSDSANSFFHDLLQTPDLSGPEAETVCKILLDLPDRWRDNVLQILPHYRGAAQSLLAQDLHDSDQEKIGRAQFWLRDLHWNAPGDAGTQETPRRRQTPATVTRVNPPSSPPILSRPEQSDSRSAPPVPMPPPAPRQAALRQTNDGSAQSGTLTCGGVIPQNAESVFPNLPPGQIKLDYDQRIWTSRLVPGERDTQRLILKNVSSGPRKTCVVHWSAIR